MKPDRHKQKKSAAYKAIHQSGSQTKPKKEKPDLGSNADRYNEDQEQIVSTAKDFAELASASSSSHDELNTEANTKEMTNEDFQIQVKAEDMDSYEEMDESSVDFHSHYPPFNQTQSLNHTDPNFSIFSHIQAPTSGNQCGSRARSLPDHTKDYPLETKTWISELTLQKVEAFTPLVVDSNCPLCHTTIISKTNRRQEIHVRSHYTMFFCPCGQFKHFIKDLVQRHQRRKYAPPICSNRDLWESDAESYHKLLADTCSNLGPFPPTRVITKPLPGSLITAPSTSKMILVKHPGRNCKPSKHKIKSNIALGFNRGNGQSATSSQNSQHKPNETTQTNHSPSAHGMKRFGTYTEPASIYTKVPRVALEEIDSDPTPISPILQPMPVETIHTNAPNHSIRSTALPIHPTIRSLLSEPSPFRRLTPQQTQLHRSLMTVEDELATFRIRFLSATETEESDTMRFWIDRIIRMLQRTRDQY